MRVKATEILAINRLNYRETSKIVSHKPSGKNASLETDGAAVYNSMLAEAKATGQPWHSSEVVQLVPVKWYIENLGGNKAEIQATIEALPDDDPRKASYVASKVKYIVVYGFCRFNCTLVDVLRDAKLDFSTIEIPAIVVEFDNAQGYFREQLRENESKNVGARPTDVADHFNALMRAIRNKAPKPRKESDVQKLLGTKRGATQKVWAAYLLGEILGKGGHDRLAMDRPKGDDGKMYDPAGFVPIRSLNRQDLLDSKNGILTPVLEAKAIRAKSKGDDSKKADELVAKAIAEAKEKAEAYIAKVITGKVSRSKVTSKADWETIKGEYVSGSFGATLANACIDGKHASFIAQLEPLFAMKLSDVKEFAHSFEIVE